jgi:hypothetical protein
MRNLVVFILMMDCECLQVLGLLIANLPVMWLVIPTTIFDTGSDSFLISNNIVKRLDLTVDRSNAPDLSGVATKSDTIGTVYRLGILVYDGENTKKIEDDFMVVKSDKDFYC